MFFIYAIDQQGLLCRAQAAFENLTVVHLSSNGKAHQRTSNFQLATRNSPLKPQPPLAQAHVPVLPDDDVIEHVYFHEFACLDQPAGEGDVFR